MPTYTYRCTNCGHQFEARQRMTADPLTECPECQGKIRRVVNSVGVVFKGKGFYVTDNRGKKAQAPGSSSGKKEDNGSGDKSASSGDSKGKGSSESKPAASEKSSAAA